jgi:hypothetical protein
MVADYVGDQASVKHTGTHVDVSASAMERVTPAVVSQLVLRNPG